LEAISKELRPNPTEFFNSNSGSDREVEAARVFEKHEHDTTLSPNLALAIVVIVKPHTLD
jgi:hypothetical protein